MQVFRIECREMLTASKTPEGQVIFDPVMHKHEHVYTPHEAATGAFSTIIPGTRVEFPNGRRGDLMARHLAVDDDGNTKLTLYFRMISKIARATELPTPS